jgi:hypothetical protein
LARGRSTTIFRSSAFICGTVTLELRYRGKTASGWSRQSRASGDCNASHLTGRGGKMKKAMVFGIFALFLAASFASAASMIKPADTDKDFCFGYAICE